MKTAVTECLTALLLLLLTTAPAQAENHIHISNAWVAEAPPAAGVNAGYARIVNRGNTTAILESVTSPVFPRIEIHQNINENDMVRMEHHPSVAISPGEALLLAPGGFHLMLYNATTELKDGGSVPLVFEFSGGDSQEVRAEVKTMPVPHQYDMHLHEETTGTAMFDRIKVHYQHLLPQHFLSGIAYRLTRITATPVKSFMISSFIKTFDVDMSIAEHPEPDRYRHFNEFFTRALKPGARPIDDSDQSIVSPVDGTVSQSGSIVNGQIIQAKGRDYSTQSLLGGDQAMADIFTDGEFITIYLSPRDYHRIHMPLSGTLKSMTYVPGDLFSVNPATTKGLDNLFARNERVVTIFDTEIGKAALIMVGAIFVGSMETVWAGEITPAGERKPKTTDYGGSGQPSVRLEKGEEMGRFNMGSTVILLFERNRIEWDGFIQPDQDVTLGRKIAQVRDIPRAD